MSAKKITATDKTKPDRTRTIRDEAEKKLKESSDNLSDLAGQDKERIIYELRVHQTELNMQAEELRRSHHELEESRDKFLDQYDFAPTGLLTINEKDSIVEVNQTCSTLLGVERSKLVRTRFSKFVAPEDQEHWHRFILNVLQQEGKQYCTLLLNCRGGSMFPARIEGIRITGSDGEITVRIAISDISEIRMANEALQHQSVTLSILNDIISTVNKAENLPELLISILAESLSLLNFDAGGIYLVDWSKRTANVVHSKNLKKEFLDEIKTVSIDTKPYDTLFIKNEPIITENYEQISLEHSQKFGFHSMASIPLISKGVAIGALNIASTKRHVISEMEKQTLISIASELGSTIVRMAAEEEVKKASKNLETLFNSIDEMVFVLDMQGHILKVNNAVLKRLLYTPEELAGTDVLLLHVPELRNEALRNVQGMIAGTIDSCPVPVLAKDGTRIEVETKVTRGLWNGKEVLIGVSRDITERKVAAEALKESESNFRTFFESMTDMIMVSTPDGQLLFTNKAVERKLGYSAKELASMPVLDLHPADKRNEAKEIFSAMLKGEQDSCPLPVATKSGALVPVETRVWFGRWNGTDCIFGISKDLSAEQEAQQRFERLFRNNPSLMALSTLPERHFCDVNDAFLKTLGYSLDEVIGKTAAELDMFPNPEQQTAVAEKLRVNGRITDFELHVRRRDGVILNGLFSGEMISSQGRQYFLTVMIDITERKAAEERLLQLSDRLSLAAKAGGVGIWDYDVVNNTLNWDDQMFALYGITREQFGGAYEAWQAGVHPEGRVRGDEEIQQALRGEGEFDTEFRVLWPDGRIRNIRALALVQRDASGKPQRMIGTNWDITEQKNAEEALRKGEEQLALVIEGSGVGLWDWQVQTGEIVFNERWAEILGYTLFELSPVTIETWIKLCHPEDLLQSDELLKKHFSKHSPMYECAVRMLHKDGHWVWVLDRGKVVEWDSDGRPIRMTGTHLDITERKVAEDAVLAANKKLNILNSVTRHDVLNQITALVMLLEIVGESVTDKETIDFVSKAKGATERINRQIDFTREYQDIGVHAPQWQNVSDLITSAKNQLTECPYELVVDLDPVEILADPLLLKVFYNLLENTIRHGEHVSTVRFFCRESNDGMILIYEDNGAGVDAESKKHLFQRGFGKHTGYGLYLIREILSISGITINETGEPGKGARFEMVVPKGAYRTTESDKLGN
jgi:PAS domain S-box-containing protein